MELIHLLLYLMYIFSSAVSELKPDYVEKFETALKSRFFVDRTLFLKDFMNKEEEVVYITAPSQSGKTTILDMVTAFFDIDNNISENETLENSFNFRLFCSPGRELKICGEKEFIKEHLGQYPVVRINYKWLESFGSYLIVLDKLKHIYAEAYEKHVLENKKFVKENEHIIDIYEALKKPMNKRSKTNIHENTVTIEEAILKLDRALYRWTGKQTIVLIDEYDAFGQALLTNPKSDELTMKIINLMKVINNRTFKATPNGIEKSIITGVLRAKDMGLSPVKMEVVKFYENKDIARYYRLSHSEVCSLVEKVSCDFNATMEYIKANYGGYCVWGLDTVVTFYSSPHVFQYLESINRNEFPAATNVEQPLNDHLSEKIKYSESFIREINQLLLNQEFTFPGFQTLSYSVLERIAPAYLSSEKKDSKYVKSDRFYSDVESYLFTYYVDLGYLTVTDRNTVQIPNQHIKKELTKIMREYYINRFNSYKLNTKDAQKDLVDIFESITAKQVKKKIYFQIYETLKMYFEQSKRAIQSESDFRTVLVYPFLEKQNEPGKVFCTELPTRVIYKTGHVERGTIDTYYKNNHHQVITIMELKYIDINEHLEEKHFTKKLNEGIKQIYRRCHWYIFENPSVDPYTMRGKNTTAVLYIAAVYNRHTSRFQTVFSDPSMPDGKRGELDFIPHILPD